MNWTTNFKLDILRTRIATTRSLYPPYMIQNIIMFYIQRFLHRPCVLMINDAPYSDQFTVASAAWMAASQTWPMDG